MSELQPLITRCVGIPRHLQYQTAPQPHCIRISGLELWQACAFMSSVAETHTFLPYRRSKVQGYPQLRSEFEASVGYMR